MSEMTKPKILPTKEIKKDSPPRFDNNDKPSTEKMLSDTDVMAVAFESLRLSGCIR